MIHIWFAFGTPIGLPHRFNPVTRRVCQALVQAVSRYCALALAPGVKSFPALARNTQFRVTGQEGPP